VLPFFYPSLYYRVTTVSNSDKRTLFLSPFLLTDGVIVIHTLPIMSSFLYFYSYQRSSFQVPIISFISLHVTDGFALLFDTTKLFSVGLRM